MIAIRTPRDRARPRWRRRPGIAVPAAAAGLSDGTLQSVAAGPVLEAFLRAVT